MIFYLLSWFVLTKASHFLQKSTGGVLGDLNLSGAESCSLEVDYLASQICHSKEQQIHLPVSIMERRQHHFFLIQQFILYCDDQENQS